MSSWAKSLKGIIAVAMLVTLGGCPLDGTNLDFPQSRIEAHRFLTQATFGPDEADIQRVMEIGYAAWIDEQFALKPSFTYRQFWTKRDAEIRATTPGSRAGRDQVIEAFFTRALTDKAQLRGRLSFALSQIFVVSFTDGVLNQTAPEMVGYHADLLDANLDGNYRQMLEAVTKSPAMGQYLTYRANAHEIPAIGRFPDENYAREIMQLFTIGLHELNPDGTVKLDAKGRPIETYTNDDIKGLAKVFTGWSHYRGPAFASAGESACFNWLPSCQDPEGLWQPMVAYPNQHSVSDKTFLGMTIPAQGSPSPQASLTAALNRLATHPNTAPFVSRQLIQRFVTSNPSPAYVGRVAKRFTDSGGNFKAIMKAILMDEEARGMASLLDDKHGKLREPLLRMTAILRAFKVNAPTLNRSGSLQPYVSVGLTNDPGTSFGQAPFFAPSVFNFFRPGYRPPQGQIAANNMVAPEMQLVNEASVIGYFNAVQDMVFNGIGPNVTPTQRNITLNLDGVRPAGADPASLALLVGERLKGGQLSSNLNAAVVNAVSNIPVPDASAGTDALRAALNRRAWMAILMVAVSPEFLISK